MDKEKKNQEKVIYDRRAGGNTKKYVTIGLTAFTVLAASIFLVFCFVQKEDFSYLFDGIKSALAPVFVGAVLAYIMNPLMSFFERKISHFLMKRVRKKKRALSFSKGVSLILTLLLVAAVIVVLVNMLAPEIKSTVEIISEEIPGQAENLLAWFNGIVGDGSVIGGFLEQGVEKVTLWVEDFLENGLGEFATGVLESVASGVINIFGIIYNIVIGFVFSIYILLSKERLTATSKKFVFATFKRRKANIIIRISRACHAKFTGAITGKVLDSTIVGILCFVGMTLLDLPYVALISVIVGVTNLIPFFGPYIGAVPSALLILFVDPWKCLWFIIFIVILQQIDCNFLDPRIVGNSIGLSPFWVLFACVVFGSLFGIMGLLLGVPAVACLHMIFGEITNARLKRKGLPTKTEMYLGIDKVDEKEVVVFDVDDDDFVDPANIYHVEKPALPKRRKDDKNDVDDSDDDDMDETDAEDGGKSGAEKDEGSEQSDKKGTKKGKNNISPKGV